MLLPWSEIANGEADRHHGAEVEMVGWMAPADDADRQAYFLLAADAICCLGCLPGDPARAIEVFARTPLPLAGDRPLHLKGRFSRLIDDPAGWRYQLRDARPAEAVPPALIERLLSRRGVLAAGAALALAACSDGKPTTAAAGPKEEAPSEYDGAARQVLAAGVTIDLHSHAGRVIRHNYPFSDVVGQMQDGSMSVICLAVVADSPVTRIMPDRRIKAIRNPAPGELYAWSGESFHRARELIEAQQLGLVTDPSALQAAPQRGPAVIMASEGADWLDTAIDRLDEAYEKYHLRHLQLTHYRPNDLGDIQTEPPVHGGLTDFGAAVIRACNRRGVVVDIAHGTYDLVKRAAAVTSKPLVLSHTSLSARPAPLSRLISADHARVVAGTGGVIGIWPPRSIFHDKAALARGMARMADVVGVEHVGLGSDMMGLTGPSTFDSYRDLPALAAALLATGFSPAETGKLLGGNYARVFAATAA